MVNLSPRLYSGIDMNFQTHNTHTHTHTHTHTLFLRVSTMSAAGRFLAAALKWRHPLTLLYRRHFTHNSVSVFVKLRCMDDKISWLA